MKIAWLRRGLIFLLISIVLLPYPLSARADSVIGLVVTPAFEGNYVPGTWLPLALSITNDGPPIDVRISAALPNDAATYVQERQLAEGESQRLEIYVPMEQAAHELALSIRDGATLLAEQTVALRPRADERMLGIVAGADPGLGLPRRQDLTTLPFTALKIAPQDLPDRPAGLGSLGIILISDLPPESLSPAQLSALLAWVHAGGQLVIGGGPAAAGMLGWLPANLHAATLGERLQIDDAPLASLAGAPGPGRLDALRLVPLPSAIATGPLAAPAWVTQRVGSGEITQLAFDPGQPQLQRWLAAPAFWDKLLRTNIRISTPLGQHTTVDSIQEQILAGTLTALPTVNQPPVDFFFAALIVYTVVIGPILALLLRRFDRQAWSWLIVPMIAIGSGALLLALAINMRADERVVTQVSLVEDLGSGQARARTFVGVLVPQGQTLSASLPEGALVRSLRGTSGRYGPIMGVRGPILQESVSVPVQLDAWELQGLMVDQLIPLESIKAEILVDDQGALVSVHNTMDQRLVDVLVIYGEQVVRLGDLQAGEEASARWPPHIHLADPGTAVSTVILSDDIAAAQQLGQAAERRTQVRQALIDAAIVSDMATIDAAPMVLAMMDDSPQEVVINATHAARQSMTLLVIHPSIRGSGRAVLPEDWLRFSRELSHVATCSGSAGIGISATSAPTTITLRLPDGLAPLRADALTLNLTSADPWPSAGVTTEIYNWEQAEWVEQDFDGPGDLALANPQPYLAQGRLQLRLSGAIAQARCLYISTEIQGTMP